MNCREVRILLFRRIDGELPVPDSAAVDSHIAECCSCAREFRLLSLPQRIAREIPHLAVSPFFYNKLKRRIESEASGNAARQVLWGLARQMVPALAGITLALLTVFAYMQLRGPDTDIYKAYDRIFMTEEQPHRMLVSEQNDITDQSVLNAIAERLSNHSSHQGK